MTPVLLRTQQAFTPINPVPATPAPTQAETTIPANTPVVLRLIDSTDSSRDSLGKEYRASLDETLLNQTGEVVAPRGSDVLIVLTNRQESGRFARKAELRLALRSLTIQGKRYDASSTDVVEASSSRTARSGKTIGGLAAAGAVIGAVARWRKGRGDWSRVRRHTGYPRRGIHIRSASTGAVRDAGHLPTPAALAGELKGLPGMIRPSE